MNTELLPITGDETAAGKPSDTSDQHACLIQFYKAFNQRDLALMAENWSQCEAVSMSNPLGDVRRGWPAIRAVYERIFHGPARVYVEFHDYSLHLGGDMFCAVGRERGYVELGTERIDLAIRTSRLYRKESGTWKQVHHHGSIDNAVLLARYQDVIKTQANT